MPFRLEAEERGGYLRGRDDQDAGRRDDEISALVVLTAKANALGAPPWIRLKGRLPSKKICSF
jgi:hypothetical protein